MVVSQRQGLEIRHTNYGQSLSQKKDILSSVWSALQSTEHAAVFNISV